MKRIRLLLLLSSFLFIIPNALFSQNKFTGDTTNTNSSYGKIDVDYVSNNIYYGRRDATAIPYITPEVGYYHKSGLFIEGALSFIPKSGYGIDLFTLDGGYDFHSNNQKFTGELSAAKYFFKDSSESVQSEVKGEADAALAYDFNIIKVSGGADVLFGSSADVVLNAALSHAFDFGNNYEWEIEPTLAVNIGSLNFYKEYYRKRRLFKRGNPRTITVTGNNNFSVLDYEFSLPLSYDTDKWSFLISPYYTLPVNPIQYSINGNFLQEEKLNNSFYIEVSAAFKF